MESFFARYRNHLVLLAVLLVQVVGLATQVRHSAGRNNSISEEDGRSVRLVRYWAQVVVGPPERMIHATRLGIAYLWTHYIDLRHVDRENQELKQTVDRLRLEQAELLEDAHQGERLQATLGFAQHYIYTTMPAQVFGSSGTDQSKVFYIDKGAADGLKPDMPVISPDGIVGKLREVFPHTSQVLAVNDQTSGAGVILETTRIRGVLKGNAAGQLEVVGLMADQRIKPGERVLTAGGDLVFPRGLPVGTVQKVSPDPERDSFIVVMVSPAAHLERLDEVLVVTSTEPRFPAEAAADMTASQTLKGSEAAAIEQQMKASQIMAERLPGLVDPNAPAAAPAATGPDGKPAPPAAALPAPKLLPAAHPDRFSPGGADGAAPTGTPQTAGQTSTQGRPQ
jgi:rod shape-determining protein MreC